ncbi:MAG: hypothetical protein AVO34_01720 [Firmicutes bacterium ML8_F2]|nr:MAG: hypothetical protein AVO34_01720 [Firmicutes bacterium ML8_F2]
MGIIQGVFEWLPISSEGITVLVASNFFGQLSLETVIRYSLFLHLGTFLAALIYFRKDVWSLLKALLNYRLAEKNVQNIFKFLVISTLVSGFLGFAIFKIFSGFEERLASSAKMITLIIGLLLLVTAGLQIKAKKDSQKKAKQLSQKDGWLLGLMQSLAVLPGLSRSGLTVSTLLLRKFNEEFALKLSFLMSLPIVLGGNIALNFKDAEFSLSMVWGLVFSFVFGLATISLLLKLARKINFGWFVFIFGILIIASLFV